MSEIPTKEQAQGMMERMSKGMTTKADADLFGAWVRTIWEMNKGRRTKESLEVEPLDELEDENWKEHAERISKGAT